MTGPLHVLLLEDNAEDAALVLRELRRILPSCAVQRVDRRDEFIAAFDGREPDLILSDHRLAEFSGMHALEFARRRRPDIPFIFVTGALDEETAVECVKAGAWDYVLKDRLVRLGPAVDSALELRRTREALKQSQEQVLHNQRMDALGRLAGSVAHDYNNLMTAVVGYSTLLAESMEGDPRREDLDEIRKAGERAVSLTRQLLAFSRKQVVEFKPVQLNGIIEGVERLLGRLLGEQIKIVTTCAPDLPLVDSDHAQLEQVLVNLAVNARDAMPHGGTFLIETTTVTLTGAHQSMHPEAAEGPHVCLSVRDSGAGIPDHILPRIFEPFFTTKPRGHGTGLGLATVYGIVRQSNGHIVVSSTVGQGTQFRLFLPVSLQEAPSDHPTVAPKPHSVAGTERILLVEDDAGVRGLARRVLASRGYQVRDVATGAEALAIARAEPGIQLVLSDIVLPDVGGPNLAAFIASLQPTAKILLMSGYTDEEIERVGVPGTNYPLLAKPFSPSALAERVREVLDQD